jgi:signal transduction histidine kinase
MKPAMPTRRLPGRAGGLRGRVVLIALLPALLVAAAMAIHFTSRGLAQAEAALQARGAHAARHLAEGLPHALAAGDFATVRARLARELRASRLVAARVVDPQRRTLAVVGEPPAADDGQYARHHQRIVLPAAGASHAMDGGDAAAHPLGEVQVILARDEIRAFRDATLLHATLLMTAALGLGAVLAWWLAARLAARLGRIGEAVERLAQGDLGARVGLAAGGEVGRLAQGIDRMAESLQAHRTELELRILDAITDLGAKKDMAERANLAKSRFFAAASHDLRQPLHALSLFVAALKTRSRETETQALIENIEASAAAMESLFEALLDISRLDAGAIEARSEHFSLQALLDILGQQFGALAAEKRLRLRIRPCGAVVYSDPLLIERILANLIANAIRYTDDGGILIGCRRRGRMLRISVIDSGRGIPPEQQASVFQEFVQLNNPARDRSKGLGLGLAIVSRLGRLLGHRIDLASRPGHGSCFSIDVPVGDPARIRASSAAGGEAGEAIPADTLVLLIDDEAAILHAMAELFDNWNVGLVTARNADEAEQWLDGLGCAPDIILSDYRLPGDTDGIAVITRLREKFGRAIPAILVTGDTAPESLQRIAQAGLPLLHKPLRPARLRALLTHLVHQRHASAMP